MASYNEMTRHAFISHMEDYIKKLLKKPSTADTDEFLKGHGIDGPLALKILLRRADPNDEYSAIITRKESIKDNGFDDNGKKNKDSFVITYKLPRKDYLKKMRNLYISLFESNIIKDSPILNEGAWGTDILDNDSALDFQTEFAETCLKNLMNTCGVESDDLWSGVGVLIDFLDKFKNDEVRVSDTYSLAIDFAKDKLKKLYNDEKFINSWSEPTEITSTIKKYFRELSGMKYQKDIMKSADELEKPAQDEQINEDGEGGGATTCGDSSGQFIQPLGKPIRRQVYMTQEQIEYLKKAINEEDGDCPVQSRIGGFGYTAPIGDGKKNKGNKFFSDANDHEDIMKKSWQG